MKIIRELGEGFFGKTYLVEMNKKKYALKIQKILQSDKKKNFKKQIWREIDLYEYVDTLSKDNQKFFTKLYSYNFSNECSLSKNIININPYLKKLKLSPWCIEFLMDYNGNITLQDYIQKKNLTIKQKYSLILQIIKIIMILYNGGYSHNDLHLGNLMVKKTMDKYFVIEGKKVPYYGLQLVVIDYGQVMHKKYGTDYKKIKWQKDFEENRERFLFREMYNVITNLISVEEILIGQCKKNGKLLPWEKDKEWTENGIKKILLHHPDFLKKTISQYLPKYNLNNLNAEFIRNNNNIFWPIELKFMYYYPKEYSKYFGWCGKKKIIFPEKNFIKILESKNYKELIKVCLLFFN